MKIPRELRALADLYDVQLEYEGFSGERMHAEPEAVLAVLRSLGAEVSNLTDVRPALEYRSGERAARISQSVLVAWDGLLNTVHLRPPGDAAERVRFELFLDDGAVLCGELRQRSGNGGLNVFDTGLRESLPLGYHELALESDTWREHLCIIAAPRKAHHNAEKRWGVFLPLYALRSQRQHGIASFADLRELTDWAGQNGAALVGTLPLLSSFLDTPFEPSPYSPVSRLFWNELFIDLDAAAARATCGLADATLHQESFAHEADRL